MNEIFNLLKKEVAKAELIGPSRHAAAIVHGNDVLSIGFNKRKTHPLMRQFQHSPYKLYLHAEIDAISKVKDKSLLRHSELYVLRLSRGNNVLISEPCQTCKNAIEYFGIKQTHWTKSPECHKC